MATVNNLLTRIHDAEGTLTTGNIPAGGGGATANTDIFLQAAQSLGKRITVTATTEGFSLVDAADNDCSAASVHVGLWFWVTHYGILDDVRIAFSSGTTPATNYDYHTFPITEVPKLGGWIRSWVDVSRTPDGTAGTALNEAALRCYGVLISFSSAPGGNAANLIIDSADYTNGGAALSLTGTSGVWSDFSTADENTTNQYGVFRKIGGVYNCFARVQLGTASSLVFNDSNFTIIFPQQNLVESTFMGITADLQHASTNIDWANGALSSAGAKQGDLIVTGTAGTFDATSCTLANLRAVTLTSKCTVSSTLISGCGLITLGGGILTNCNIVNATGAVAVLAASPGDADNITGTTFTSDGTGHGLEINGSVSNITLTNLTWVGYAGTDGSSGNEAIYVNTSAGSMNLTISGGSVPSIRVAAGVSVTVISNAVSATATVTTSSGTAIQSATVMVKAANGTGPFPFEESVTITNSGTTATVAHTGHGMATNDKVLIKGASHNANNGIFSITKTGDDSYTYVMGSSPGSNPTGTITSTFVVLSGTTDVNGQITMSRVFPSDQPVIGWARKSSGSPYYKTGPINGTVDSATGASLSAVLILDE